MQTVSAGFTTASTAKVRKPVHKTEISWTKGLNPNYGYFTIGVSTIGGTDIIPGNGSAANEFAFFNFADETSYVESIEIDRFFDKPSSVARAAIDIVLNNATGRFDLDGALGANIKQNRPVRLSIGFNGTELITLFCGQIADFPKLDTQNKTLTVHGLDLMIS